MIIINNVFTQILNNLTYNSDNGNENLNRTLKNCNSTTYIKQT